MFSLEINLNSQLTHACLLLISPVHLTHQSSTGVSGSLSQGSRKTMHFNVYSDLDGNRALSLRRADGKNLVQANWTSDDQGLHVSRFRVMSQSMNKDLENDPPLEQQQAEGKAFDSLRHTSQFKSLPFLSQILGTKYNVTGYENSAALSLHRLALHAENLHKSIGDRGKCASAALCNQKIRGKMFLSCWAMVEDLIRSP